MLSLRLHPVTAALVLAPLAVLVIVMLVARSPSLKYRVIKRPLHLIAHVSIFSAGLWSIWSTAWNAWAGPIVGDSAWWWRVAASEALILLCALLIKLSIDTGVYDVSGCGVSLRGKTAIVTGGSAGIGLETARYLAMLGCKVVIACRNEAKGNGVAEEINRSVSGAPGGPGKVTCMVLDLVDLESVRSFVKAYRRAHPVGPHLLVNNAGLSTGIGHKTVQGYEKSLGVMHFGHFYLTKLLREGIEKVGTRESPARIVTVASLGHTLATFDKSLMENDDGEGDLRGEIVKGAIPAYARAKLANILFARELPNRWKNPAVASHSMHPGAVMSDIWRSKNRLFMAAWAVAMRFVFRSCPVAAQVVVYLLVDEGAKGPGSVYANCFAGDAQESLSADARDAKLAARLWDVSERVVADFEAGVERVGTGSKKDN